MDIFSNADQEQRISEHSSFNWEGLPNEIRAIIAKFLPLPDLLSLRTTNKANLEAMEATHFPLGKILSNLERLQSEESYMFCVAHVEPFGKVIRKAARVDRPSISAAILHQLGFRRTTPTSGLLSTHGTENDSNGAMALSQEVPSTNSVETNSELADITTPPTLEQQLPANGLSDPTNDADDNSPDTGSDPELNLYLDRSHLRLGPEKPGRYNNERTRTFFYLKSVQLALKLKAVFGDPSFRFRQFRIRDCHPLVTNTLTGPPFSLHYATVTLETARHLTDRLVEKYQQIRDVLSVRKAQAVEAGDVNLSESLREPCDHSQSVIDATQEFKDVLELVSSMYSPALFDLLAWCCLDYFKEFAYGYRIQPLGQAALIPPRMEPVEISFAIQRLNELDANGVLRDWEWTVEELHCLLDAIANALPMTRREYTAAELCFRSG